MSTNSNVGLIQEINTGECTLLAVGVHSDIESDSTGIYGYPGGRNLQYEFKNSDKQGYIELPAGEWELMGLSHELTEEQWRQVIPFIDCSAHVDTEDNSLCKGYRNFLDDEALCKKATESAKTLMEANELFLKNPYGEREPEERVCCAFKDECCKHFIKNPIREKWHEAQARVGTYLVLKLKEVGK